LQGRGVYEHSGAMHAMLPTEGAGCIEQMLRAASE
jgi:hypothetical protein